MRMTFRAAQSKGNRPKVERRLEICTDCRPHRLSTLDPRAVPITANAVGKLRSAPTALDVAKARVLTGLQSPLQLPVAKAPCNATKATAASDGSSSHQMRWSHLQ